MTEFKKLQDECEHHFWMLLNKHAKARRIDNGFQRCRYVDKVFELAYGRAYRVFSEIELRERLRSRKKTITVSK